LVYIPSIFQHSNVSIYLKTSANPSNPSNLASDAIISYYSIILNFIYIVHTLPKQRKRFMENYMIILDC